MASPLSGSLRLALAGVAAIVALVGAVALVLALLPRPSTILTTPVQVGVTTDAPGASYQDQNTNQRSGFDVQLVNWLSENADTPFNPTFVDVIVGTREQQLVRGGDSGGVDIVVSTYTITSERERTIDFAGPYLQTTQSVMVRADERQVLTNPNQLAGKTVCAQSGSTSISELRRIPDVIATERTTLLQCVLALQEESVDAVSTDELLLRGYAARDSNLRVEAGVRFGAVQMYGIGLHPTEGTEDCELVNDLLQRFITSEVWDAAFVNAFGPNLDKDEFRPNPRACVSDAEPGG